jgi:hypothetical protein
MKADFSGEDFGDVDSSQSSVNYELVFVTNHPNGADGWYIKKEAYDQVKAERDTAIKILKAQGRGDPLCFCGVAIGHPAYSKHSRDCVEAMAFIADFGETEG